MRCCMLSGSVVGSKVTEWQQGGGVVISRMVRGGVVGSKVA